MSGKFTITVQEARGYVAIPADLFRLAVVIGCSSAGSALSPFFLSATSAIANRGYGDAVDTLCQIIEQRQSSGTSAKFPAAMYTTPGSTAGSYGAIDNTGVTGTALFSFDSTSAPRGTYEPRFKVINGGTVGTDGITFQWSLNGGRSYSNTTALGTADNYTMPNSGVKVVLTPSATDLTALNTLINELFTDLNAHVILTTGTVHSTADSGDVVSSGTYPSATNTATRVARVNAIKAAYNAHRVKGSGASIHINVGGDTTNIVAVANATDDESALTLALDIKAKLNAHDAGTTWHTIADATNTVSSPAPVAGTLVAGDVAGGRTFGPAPSTTDVAAAFVAIAAAGIDQALIICDFPCNAAMAAFITTGLNALNAVGKRCTVLTRARLPDFETSETEAEWLAYVAADFASFADSRILVRAGYGLVTDATTTRQYFRSTLQQLAADTVRVGLSDWPCAPADRAEPNVSLSDSSGTTVGHDEGTRGAATGLSDNDLGNRFSCEQRLDDYQRREAVFNSTPWVMFAADEGIRHLMARRVANEIQRDAASAAIPLLGKKYGFTPADPAVPGSQPMLTETSRNAIHGAVFGRLSAKYADHIQNADDADVETGLVQVNPVVTVTGGTLIGVTVTISALLFGYLLRETVTYAPKE